MTPCYWSEGAPGFADLNIIDDNLPIIQHPAYTISMWVKVTETGQNHLRLFSESPRVNNDPLLNLSTRNNGSDDSIDIYLRDSGSPNHQFSTGIPLDGTWRHIAYTHNDLTKTIQPCVDGVLDRDTWIFKDLTSPDIDTTSVGGILRANTSHHVEG